MLKKKTATIVVLFLMLTIAIPFFALPTANAHTPAWQVPTWTYVSANPTPVGVGQEVTVVFWINWVPPTAAGKAGDRWFFYLDITKPDGTKQTVGPLTSDPVGGSYYIFTPDPAGNYTITARFGPQVITGSNGTGIYNGMSFMGTPIADLNDIYLASSATTTLTVQEEPIR